jgi:hypothetical protein
LTQKALFEALTVHFQERAAFRSLDDRHRHTDGGIASYLEALIAFAAFVPPALSYIAAHVGKHLIDRATDALIEKAKKSASEFMSTGLKRLSGKPTVNFNPKEFDEIASKADEFSDLFIHQSQLLERKALEEALEIGRLSAQKLMSEQLKLDNEEAHRVAISMVIDIRKAVAAAAKETR